MVCSLNQKREVMLMMGISSRKNVFYHAFFIDFFGGFCVFLVSCVVLMTYFCSPDKTPEEIRKEFNITEPFSPEVERKLRDENKWSTEPPVGR